ncbi:ankyrin [Microthyrium microscopicum]|uniref:Ankyrin n=1 Tax=Microthyrium microscopicum TaxID=703497 RepID=A0A6A6U6Z8_9PEZI|nr:ankyrin [Microthyrium microscopicum]
MSLNEPEKSLLNAAAKCDINQLTIQLKNQLHFKDSEFSMQAVCATIQYSRLRRDKVNPNAIPSLELLIEHGARLNSSDITSNQQTPLELAIELGTKDYPLRPTVIEVAATEMVKILLKAGADPKANKADSRVLKSASKKCLTNIVVMLLSLGEIFDEKDRSDALMVVTSNWTLYRYRASVVKALVTAGVTQESVMYAWRHFLTYDSRGNEVKGYEALSEDEDEDLAGVLKILIDTGAAITLYNNNHLHRLAFFAVGHKALELALQLPGVNPRLPGRAGWQRDRTPLQLATEAGNREAVILLLRYATGVNLQGDNFQEDNNDTIFHLAARSESPDLFRFLVEGNKESPEFDSTKHCSIHEFCKSLPRDAKGDTPLQIATRESNSQLVNFLLDNGASAVD